ncbi:MAG: hypothetical protein KZQ58_05435 [gamma proteobacterium symbiont of Bathyaustriella thionipta]|nr:hypothetical protein [gamma proteobacterium symbiont of Bathyaustriella thionipta]
MANKNTLSGIASQTHEWLWRKKFEHTFGSYAGLSEDDALLRLIFGLQGSHVDWLTELLLKSLPDAACFIDPLANIKPPLQLGRHSERLASDYHKDIPQHHPAVRVLRLLGNSQQAKLEPYRSKRTSTEANPVLIKEQQAPLLLEAIIRQLQIPSLLMLRDPVRTADRVFSLPVAQQYLFKYEFNSLLQPAFLLHFLPLGYKPVLHTAHILKHIKNEREKLSLQQVLSTALINAMFRMLAAKYPRVSTISHESLFRQPQDSLKILSQFIGDKWTANSEMTVMSELPDPDLSATQTQELPWRLLRPYDSFSQDEVACCRQLLIDCGLSDHQIYGNLDKEMITKDSACEYAKKRIE